MARIRTPRIRTPGVREPKPRRYTDQLIRRGRGYRKLIPDPHMPDETAPPKTSGVLTYLFLRDPTLNRPIRLSGSSASLLIATGEPGAIPENILKTHRTDVDNNELLIWDAGEWRYIATTNDVTAKINAATAAKGARVYRNVDTVITTGIITVLSFNSERYDTDTIWSPANPTRLTCVSAGYYSISGHVTWTASGWESRRLAIRLNGNDSTIIAGVNEHASSSGNHSNIISTLHYLAAGDYVELLVYQDSSVDLSALALPMYSPEFAMQRISG